MVKSMTGYGRCREVVDGRDILVEVKSDGSRKRKMLHSARITHFCDNTHGAAIGLEAHSSA